MAIRPATTTGPARAIASGDMPNQGPSLVTKLPSMASSWSRSEVEGVTELELLITG